MNGLHEKHHKTNAFSFKFVLDSKRLRKEEIDEIL